MIDLKSVAKDLHKLRAKIVPPDDDDDAVLVQSTFEAVTKTLQDAGWKVKLGHSFRGTSVAIASKRGTKVDIVGGANLTSIELMENMMLKTELRMLIREEITSLMEVRPKSERVDGIKIKNQNTGHGSR